MCSFASLSTSNWSSWCAQQRKEEKKFSTILKTFTPQFLLSIMFHNNVQLLQNWFILINPYQLNPSVGINLNVNLHFMLLPLKSNLTVNLHNKHSLFVLALRMLCCNVIHMTYYDDDNARRAQFFSYSHTYTQKYSFCCCYYSYF